MEQTERRVALVTGASSGIGRAAAIVLAERGFDVGVAYRSDEAGARKAAVEIAALGRRAVLRRLDLADADGAAAAVDELIDDMGRIDVFVNNAGVTRRRPFLQESLGDFRHILDVDLVGPFLCAQVAARRMVTAGCGGRIVNVTSVHEHVPLRGCAAYAAAKGGLGLLTKVMALELAEHGITVNAVAPGETATPMNNVAEGVDAAALARPDIPIGRPGRPREVAAAIAYLASPEAAYTTGASFVVDGGLLLMAAIANQDRNERAS